jgi:hypothetical protein
VRECWNCRSVIDGWSQTHTTQVWSFHACMCKREQFFLLHTQIHRYVDTHPVDPQPESNTRKMHNLPNTACRQHPLLRVERTLSGRPQQRTENPKSLRHRSNAGEQFFVKITRPSFIRTRFIKSACTKPERVFPPNQSLNFLKHITMKLTAISQMRTIHTNKKGGIVGHEQQTDSLIKLLINQQSVSTSGFTLIPGLSASPDEIASQTFEKISDGFFFSPSTEDIFDDFEPLPFKESSSAVHSLSLVQDTLDQVLREDFLLCLDDIPLCPAADIMPQPMFAPSSASVEMKRGLDALQNTVFQRRPPKRQRIEEDNSRFRRYQEDQWTVKFDELVKFRNAQGHCCVPHTFNENPTLARWVKRQRYQQKLKKEGKKSTMNDERVLALGKIGFVWDSHNAAWQDRLNDLKMYRQVHGHCNVPSNCPKNPQLATWIKCQRRQYRLFCDGKPSNISLERITGLTNLGFEWMLRSQTSTTWFS